jgi:hypothetical protein
MRPHDYEREILLEVERDFLKDLIRETRQRIAKIRADMPTSEAKGQLYDLLGLLEGVEDDEHLIALFCPLPTVR